MFILNTMKTTRTMLCLVIIHSVSIFCCQLVSLSRQSILRKRANEAKVFSDAEKTTTLTSDDGSGGNGRAATSISRNGRRLDQKLWRRLPCYALLNRFKHYPAKDLLAILSREHLLRKGKYGWPPVWLLLIQLLCLCLINNRFTCSGKSKPVKLEVSRAVILPLT